MPALLNETEIDELKAITLHTIPGECKKFNLRNVRSIDEADRRKKLEMMKSIQQFLKPKLSKYLHKYKMPLRAF